MNKDHSLIITQTYRGYEWLQSRHEEIIDPDLPIIDPHHHFSDHWGGYFGSELLDDLASGHNVIGTVYIQCGYGYKSDGPEKFKPVGETEHVVKIAETCSKLKDSPLVAAGIVGYADLLLGAEVDDVLASQVQAGNGRFRGIRCSAARHDAFKHGVLPRPLAHLFLDRKFREGFALLAKHKLSFESWTYHHQLGEVLDLARAFPDTSIIVNHIGGLLGVGPYENNRAQAEHEWLPKIKDLATCPNVTMKLGGLGTAVYGYKFHEKDIAPSSEAIAGAWGPYFKTCIELFGPARCMFESNFPVDRAACSYQILWNAFKRIASEATPEEKRALFHDNAARIYRLSI